MALGLSPPQSYGRTPSTATARACRQMMDLSPDASFLLATPKKRTHHRILTPGSPSTCRLLQQRYEKKLWENLVKPQSVPEELRPHRVLSAPSMQDDFYLKLMDWSKDNGLLAVALDNVAYLWQPEGDRIRKLCALRGKQSDDGESITAITWMAGGRQLAVGGKSGRLMLFDIESHALVQNGLAHKGRVTTLAAALHGSQVLTSGSRDKSIQHYDERTPDWMVARWDRAHQQEVCGLHWEPLSPSPFGHGRSMLASGGNDNVICIWDGLRSNGRPLHCLTEHTAAVKALAWSPTQRGILASGGGTADKSLRLWNINHNSEHSIRAADTGSQVCSIVWSPKGDELVTAHGFCDNLCLRWTCPSLRQTAIMRGHEQRVLYMSLAPDGRTLATGGADETIRLWTPFSPPPAPAAPPIKEEIRPV